jgi:hypothetical protein
MSTREDLQANITAAEKNLNAAKEGLAAFDALPSNNVFETLAKAEGVLEDKLRGLASADCEGSYNRGADEYTQEFIVDGVHYIGTLKVEYNRHDKTYYYVEEASFSYVPAPV